MAATPSAENPFHIRQNNSANSGNHATGDIVVWGVQNVQPPAGSSYVYGVSGICPNGKTCDAFSTDPDWVRQRLFELDWTLLPHQYYASTAYNAEQTGARLLLLSASSSFPRNDTAFIWTPTLGDAGAMPFVQSMSINGAGLTPTISWTLPASTPNGIDQMRIRVQDVSHPVTVAARYGAATSFQQADLVWQSPALGSTSLTLPAGVLSFGTSYAISIDLSHTRADGSVASRSSSYFDFTPIDPATLPGDVSNIALPTLEPVPTTSGALAGPVYGFHVDDVGPDHITFIDPVVAAGFSYATGAGDPNFKAVQVASNVGDGLYEVWTWNAGAWQLSGRSGRGSQLRLRRPRLCRRRGPLPDPRHRGLGQRQRVRRHRLRHRAELRGAGQLHRHHAGHHYGGARTRDLLPVAGRFRRAARRAAAPDLRQSPPAFRSPPLAGFSFLQRPCSRT